MAEKSEFEEVYSAKKDFYHSVFYFFAKGLLKFRRDFDRFRPKTSIVPFTVPQAIFLRFWHPQTQISFKFLDFSPKSGKCPNIFKVPT